MTAHLFAPGDRKTRIIAVAALLLAVLITMPAHANAQSRSEQMLAEGIGMHGAPSIRVRTLQRALAHRGLRLGAAGVDGRFGPMTATAVRRFQAQARLTADGIVGPRTRRALHLRVATAGSRRGATSRSADRPAGSGARKRNRAASPDTHQQTAATHRTARPGTATATHRGTKAGHRASAPTPASGGTKPSAAPTIPTITRRRAPEETNVNNPWILPIVLGAAAAGLIAIAAFLALALTRALRARAERHSAATRPVFAYGEPSGDTDDEPAAPALPRDERGRAVLALVPDPDHSSEVVLLGGAGHAPPAPGERVIGYVPGGGAGPTGADPTARIEDACRASGWDLVEVVTDPEHGSPTDRPALVSALERVDRGEASAVVVGHADDIRRLNGHAAALSDWLRGAGTGLLVQDIEHAPGTHGRGAPAAVVMLDRGASAPAARRRAH